MDGEEWNTAALAPDKLRLAGVFVKRLRHRFAPGGFLHWGRIEPLSVPSPFFAEEFASCGEFHVSDGKLDVTQLNGSGHRDATMPG